MKIFLKFLLVLYVALPSALNALEPGKWSFEETDEYCYIGSLATETDLPSDKKRGDFYVLVYKNIGNPETVVQIEAGYSYKVPSDIIINIDNGELKICQLLLGQKKMLKLLLFLSKTVPPINSGFSKIELTKVLT